MYQAFIKQHRLSNDFIELAKTHFVPLAEDIIAKQSEIKATNLATQNETSPFFVGVNGCQGSGKSTLSDFICHYIENQTDLKVIVLSLDDFYFSQQKRSQLAEEVHPLLKTRGVPGTHDAQQMQAVFQQLAQTTGSIALPRFNKATDNPFPVEQWPNIDLPVDIVIFEGWCWGVPAQKEQDLMTPVNALEQQRDQDGKWRTYVNKTLINDYLPLYDEMNFWVLLKAPSFDCVYQWRLEQENKLKEKSTDSNNAEVNGIMSEQQVLEFIQFYQRLTEHSLTTMIDSCDRVFYLNDKRQIEKTTQKKQNLK
jgi:D-glycerate 3-kinase